MMNPLKNGTLIAITAASLFAAACSKKADNTGAAGGASADKTAKVHCEGVNDCKGKSACATAKNSCAGQNGCKGQGMVEMTAQDCTTKGGTVMAKK
jgi:hypothetical protein